MCYYLNLNVLFSVLPPPADVQAIQSNPSAPVEVSWSPPPDQGGFEITGYRIFYGNGQNVSVPIDATSIGLRVEGRYDHQMVSLRSESDQLYSELVSVTVGKVLGHHIYYYYNEHDLHWLHSVYDMAKNRPPHSCSREIGAVIGVMICIDVMVIICAIMVLVLHWWR